MTTTMMTTMAMTTMMTTMTTTTTVAAAAAAAAEATKAPAVTAMGGAQTTINYKLKRQWMKRWWRQRQ